MTGVGYSEATFTADAFVTQTVGTGVTAVGRVVNYDQNTGVLKLWQDRSVAGFTSTGIGITNPTYGYLLEILLEVLQEWNSLLLLQQQGCN